MNTQFQKIESFQSTRYSARVLTIMGRCMEITVKMILPACIIGVLITKGSMWGKVIQLCIFFSVFKIIEGVICFVSKAGFDFLTSVTVKGNRVKFFRVTLAGLNTIVLVPVVALLLVLGMSIITGLVHLIRA